MAALEQAAEARRLAWDLRQGGRLTGKGTAVGTDGDILEAVFRYQFEHNASAAQGSVAALCLRFARNEDPPPEFVRRFADLGKVKPVSACSVRQGGAYEVIDRQTGQQALIFELRAVRRPSPSTAEVDGGYYEAGESASSNEYQLELKGSRWVVVKNTSWLPRRWSHGRRSERR